MKLIKLYLLLSTLITTILSQKVEMSGRIFMDKNSKPLGLVTVSKSVSKGGYSVISDNTGRFSIMLPVGRTTLIFSRLGYETVEKIVDVKRLRNRPVRIRMKQSPFLLGEIKITGIDGTKAKKLVQKVKENLTNTLVMGSYQAKGWQQFYIKTDGNYTFWAEIFFDIYSGGFLPKGHAYDIVKSTEYRVSDGYDLPVLFKTYKAPIIRSADLYSHTLFPVMFNDYYYFQIGDTSSINNHNIVTVNYRFNTDYKYKIHENKYNQYGYRGSGNAQYGKLQIDMTDYRVLNISNKSIHSLLINKKYKKESITNTCFKTVNKKSFISKQESCSTYTKDSLNYTYHILTQYSDFDTSYISKELISKHFNCNLHLTAQIHFDIQESECKKNIYYFEPKKATPEDKRPKYHSVFWSNKPTPAEWNKIQSDLKFKWGRSLENQFVTNNNYLISKQEMSAKTQSNKGYLKKELSKYYKYLKNHNFFK